MTSTLTMRLGRPSRQSTGGGQGQEHVTRLRTVEIDYRASVGGTIIEHVTGDRNPAFCGPLGSCGLTGSLTLRQRVMRTAGSLQASGPLKTPAGELLGAVGLRAGSGRRGVSSGGAVFWSRGGTLSADLRQGPLSCVDHTDLGGGSILLERSGTHVVVDYTPGEGGSFGTEALRTRCPGPEGPQNTIASARVPLTTLARRRVTISLNRGARFSEDGYSGFTTPHLKLTLTRVRVRSGTSTEITSSVGSG